jgi:ribosome modulation factor
MDGFIKMFLPKNFMQWNRALRGAFLKGAASNLEGSAIEVCPYTDKRKNNGKLTWSRGFQAAWRDGWLYAKSNPDDALITLKFAYKRHKNALR